jgi:hypothetical protein
MLGIVYLGDFALEEGREFDVCVAQHMAVSTAVSCCLELTLAQHLIENLVRFYHRERTRLVHGASDLGRRYVLKSADALLLQMMVLKGTGRAVEPSEFEALRSACTALEVLDDLNDVDEDAMGSAGNPFIAPSTPPAGRIALLRRLVHTPATRLAAFHDVANRCSTVSMYCGNVLRRISAACTIDGERCLGEVLPVI